MSLMTQLQHTWGCQVFKKKSCWCPNDVMAKSWRHWIWKKPGFQETQTRGYTMICGHIYIYIYISFEMALNLIRIHCFHNDGNLAGRFSRTYTLAAWLGEMLCSMGPKLRKREEHGGSLEFIFWYMHHWATRVQITGAPSCHQCNMHLNLWMWKRGIYSNMLALRGAGLRVLFCFFFFF